MAGRLAFPLETRSKHRLAVSFESAATAATILSGQKKEQSADKKH